MGLVVIVVGFGVERWVVGFVDVIVVSRVVRVITVVRVAEDVVFGGLFVGIGRLLVDVVVEIVVFR